ncbi:hypothetical protein DFAR_3180025 [Desulfarculales bacterium]
MDPMTRELDFEASHGIIYEFCILTCSYAAIRRQF